MIEYSLITDTDSELDSLEVNDTDTFDDVSLTEDPPSPPPHDCWHLVLAWIRFRRRAPVHASPYDDLE